MKEEKYNRKLMDRVILVMVALVLCIPLLNSSFYLYNNDGLTTISKAYESLKAIEKNGFFSQNVLISLGNNFGYSWSLFSGNLPTGIIAVIAHLIGNLVVSYKIASFLAIAISGVAMYRFAHNETCDRNVSLLIAILYMAFPYHLSTLYNRNNFDELLAFVFIPYVFLGLSNLVKVKRQSYYFAIGEIGMLLSSNVLFICVNIYAIIYLIINRKTVQIKDLVLNITIALIISSCFWYPSLETRLYGNYHVDNITKEELLSDTLNLGLGISQIFVTGDGNYSVWELGPHMIIMLAFSWLAYKNLENEYKRNYVFCLAAGMITLFLSTKYFPWKKMPKIFLFITPWKLSEFTCLFFSYVCGLNMYTLIKKFNLRDVFIISLISILYLLALIRFIPTSDNIKDISEYRLGVITGKEHEYVNGMSYMSYLPENAYNNRFYIATREDSAKVIEGEADIINMVKVGTMYTANVTTKSDKNTIELPFIYYPGYEIRYDGMLVKGYETENGFLGITIGKDNGELSVKYKGTSSMIVSFYISILGVAILVVLSIRKNVENTRVM